MNIRNFCIIAHINHGKSTLADRFLEITGTVAARNMKKQLLDTMELEQQRGITIKLAPVRMEYKSSKSIAQSPKLTSNQALDYGFWVLNLIDTPGHVDFSYEVSRTLAAVEGAILVVDASQGIQAQTLAHFYKALEHDLTIIPVINKIDLPSAHPEEVAAAMEKVFGFKKEEILLASAKQGTGIEEILDAVVARVPAPAPMEEAALKALVFDSTFDPFRGVVLYVRLFSGGISKGDKIKLMRSGAVAETMEVGVFKPAKTSVETLSAGEIGYIITDLKTIRTARVGDTVTTLDRPVGEPLAGYGEPKPFVFSSFYPAEAGDFTKLRDSMEKLQLNDASLTYSPEHSPALGNGFRAGFLGLLHLEIVKERLEREYGIELVITTPSVSYEIVTTGGKIMTITDASELPSPEVISEIREPWIAAGIITPSDYLGGSLKVLESYRGQMKNIEYINPTQAIVHAELPLAAILVDFYDDLKSATSGYASVDYRIASFRPADLVRLTILVAEEPVPTLSRIVPRQEAEKIGRRLLSKMKELLPRQQFALALQAAVGGKIIARETLSALRKDVTAKLYGGDVTRKKKLLEKQKKGKAKLKAGAKVQIPSEIYLDLLKK